MRRLPLIALALLACGKGGAPKTSAASAPKKAEAVDAGVDHGKFTQSIKSARESMEKTPCDKKMALMLGDYLNRAKDFQGARAWVGEFEAKCEKWPRLWWVKQHACEQLEDWACAVETGTGLIDNDPTDSDYWWWRGKSEVKLQHHERAKADFLQSMANKPTGFPAWQLAQFAEEKLKRPCDGALLIQWWIEHGKRTEEDWIDPARKRLFLAGKCGKLAGQGKTSIAVPKNAPVVKVEVKVDGVKGKFILDEQAGTSAVTPAFATKAKLVAGADEIELMAAGKKAKGTLAPVKKLELGKASVGELDVAVVEGLPDGFDGVLGLNALMQWQVKDTAKGLELAPVAR